ncbi:hypothetical protein C8Q74DRAFT_1020932 [Fomes fomentarius]|nr:hypothetical protein C8Q74DRAFT_1020932 [Fomes fomentarius]
MQRGPSSQSEREREREREVARERSKATLRSEDTAAVEKRSGPSYSQSQIQREEARERQREMKRVQSRGEALVVAEDSNAGTQTETQTQTQTQAQAQASRAPGERVLLPARKVTRKRVGADGASHAEPEPERGKPSGGHGLGERADADQVRVVGERVLLPVRKVTKRVEKAGVVHAAKVEQERPIPITSSTSGRTLEDTPRYAQNRYDQDQDQDVSISAPYRWPSPPTSTPIPGPSSPTSPTRGVVIKVSSEPDGWEDKFSTPKRGHMNRLASPTSPTFIMGSAPSSSASPMSASSRPAWEPSKSSELSTSASVVTQSSSSSGTGTGTSTSSKTALDNQVRIVGDRVLLPARKITRRTGEAKAGVEKEPNKDKEKEKERERESSPERGRTMSINKRPSLVRSKHTADGPQGVFPASTPTQLSSSEGLDPDVVDCLDTSGSTSPIREPTSMSGMLVPPESPTRPDMERAHPWTSASMTSETTSTSTSTKPAAPSETSPSHPSANSNNAETKGRPPRRRKYSLLAAFGLPVSRTASDSESSTPADAKPPTPTPPSAPPPAPPAPSAKPTPAADEQPGSAVTASVSADDQPREQVAPGARGKCSCTRSTSAASISPLTRSSPTTQTLIPGRYPHAHAHAHAYACQSPGSPQPYVIQTPQRR